MGVISTADSTHLFWDPACYRKTADWVRRHWGLALHFVLAMMLAGIALSFWSIRQSPPAQLALAQARSSTIAADVLGSPMRQGLFVTGMVERVHSGQYADLRMRVYGPKGEGVLYANAAKMNGIWQLTSLDLAIEGRPGRVNLLPIQSTIPR